MAEIKIGPGDAVSRLAQALAKEVGIDGFHWTGKGDQDIRAICIRAYNAEIIRKNLWDSVMEITQLPNWKELPEAIQATVMATILRARACIELTQKT